MNNLEQPISEEKEKEKELVVLWISDLAAKAGKIVDVTELMSLTMEELYAELLKYNPRAEARPTRRESNVA